MQHDGVDQSVPSRIDRKLLRWLPVLFWMGFIFCLSAQPDLPHHGDDLVDLTLKKLGHMAEFGILAGLVWWAWPKGSGGSSRQGFLSAFILSGLYAISDEIHQVFVPGRDGQLLDVGFDLLGGLMTLIFITCLSNLVNSREPQ